MASSPTPLRRSRSALLPMEGSATKQVLMKFRWFKSMLQFNLDFNTVPTDKQTVVCEKYGLWSVVEKLAGTTRRRRQSCTSDRGKTRPCLRRNTTYSGVRGHESLLGVGRVITSLDPKAVGDLVQVPVLHGSIESCIGDKT